MSEADEYGRESLLIDFDEYAKSGVDLELLDPICEALSAYLEANPPRRGGYCRANRAIALKVVRELLQWENVVWNHG